MAEKEFISETVPQSEKSNSSSMDASLLISSLFPDDSYTPEGVYWADLPSKERGDFVRGTSNKEARRELGVLGSMFKADPLSPFSAYFSRYFVNGAGLFVEGYVLFSISNVSALFGSVWPTCWKTYKVCTKTSIQLVNYIEIVGIIIGQIVVGVEGDWVGRRFGLIQDATIMLIGVILLTAVWGTTLQGWVIAYAFSLCFYSIGVGGEYPMTSTKALESGGNGLIGTRDDRLHRGRNVVLAFAGQGWGQVFNQAILMLLLIGFNHGRQAPPYSKHTVQWVYRLSFGIIGVLHLWLLYYRVYLVKDADNKINAAKKRLHTSGYDIASLRLVGSHYSGRLIATAFCWGANDFFFYGNKIFSSVFIGIVHPGATLFVTWEINLLVTVIQLVGYYLAALLIDHKFYGRKRMQLVGFAVEFLCYLFGAIFFHKLQKHGAPVKAFQFMFYLSAFFNQFGPNCTTFLVAAEVYPASVRATAHGFSAACGKLGALAPTILYNYIDNETKFWVVPWFGLVAAIATMVFLPDTTGLDLREQERYWQCVREGRPEDYHGVAIHPRHLSWYEVHVLHRNKHYDPELDRIQKIDELRVLYESHLIAQADESQGDEEHAFITDGVAKYFASEGVDQRITAQARKEQNLHQRAPQTVQRSKLEETMP